MKADINTVYISAVDHQSLGLDVSLGSKFNGSIIHISGAHTTPIDCLQLCEATGGCNAFAISNSLKECQIGIGREESLVENADFDTYFRGKIIYEISVSYFNNMRYDMSDTI